ncbi:hypothetical protein ACH47B_24535 [Rhodococcus sp. NPDC019627]|uniref:hypothetical protein n=1 Tax=unclassified Rhodococcus (in: high G+C Gram-positive bacteria) TaxID=192944 RepID=UPI0033DF535D
MKKSDRDIMEILEAYDATGSAHGSENGPPLRHRPCAGMPVTGPSRRPRIIDDHLPKIEEWVERSKGKVRADIVHERLRELGSTGLNAPPGAVADAKSAWQAAAPTGLGAPPTQWGRITVPGVMDAIRLG